MKYICLFALLIVLANCKSKPINSNEPATKLPVIPLYEALDHLKNEPIKLSSVGSGFDYLPMETSGECLLGNGNRAITFQITPKYIYSDRKKFLRKDGSFVTQMGYVGRGPGEYIRAFSTDVDTTNYNYYVLSNTYQLFTYSDANELLNTVKINDESRSGIKCLSNNKLAMLRDAAYCGVPYSGLRIIEASTGDTINEFGCEGLSSRQAAIGNSNNYFVGIGLGFVITWENKGTNYYYDPVCDTIYKLSENGIQPVMVLDKGKFKPDYDSMLDNKKFEANRNNYMEIRSISQVGSNLQITFSMGIGQKGRYFDAIFNETNNELYAIEMPNRVFENDLNLLDVYDLYKIPNEDCYWFYAESGFLVGSLLPKLKAMDYATMSKENKKLFDIIKNRKIEDNPVLCFLK